MKDETRVDTLQSSCKGIALSTMQHVQMMCSGDETEFQYAMSLVIHQMMEHLGLSLAARKTREEILGK